VTDENKATDDVVGPPIDAEELARQWVEQQRQIIVQADEIERLRDLLWVNDFERLRAVRRSWRGCL
jgi:hypothetical protein